MTAYGFKSKGTALTLKQMAEERRLTPQRRTGISPLNELAYPQARVRIVSGSWGPAAWSTDKQTFYGDLSTGYVWERDPEAPNPNTFIETDLAIPCVSLCPEEQSSWDYDPEDPWSWYFARLFIAVELKDGSGLWSIVSTCTVEAQAEYYYYDDYNVCDLWSGNVPMTEMFQTSYFGCCWPPYTLPPRREIYESFWLEARTYCWTIVEGRFCGPAPWSEPPTEECPNNGVVQSILIFNTAPYVFHDVPGGEIVWCNVLLPGTDCEKWCPYDPATRGGQLVPPERWVNTYSFYGALTVQYRSLLDTMEQDQQ